MTGRTLFLDESPDGKGRFHREHVQARIAEDGSVAIYGALQGALVEETFGDWDDEFGCKIKSTDLAYALIVVLAETFNADKPLTYWRLLELLEKEGLDVEDWMFT